MYNFATISLALGALLLSFSLPSANAQTNTRQCDPNYTGACIQPYSQGDVDCGEIKDRNFKSIGSDPHRLDGDKDGIACEKK